MNTLTIKQRKMSFATIAMTIAGVMMMLMMAITLRPNVTTLSLLASRQTSTTPGQYAQHVRPLSGTPDKPMLVKKCSDFMINGNGDNNEWKRADWLALAKLDPEGTAYKSEFKVLYSGKGIYVLFRGDDNKITTSNYQDMDKIWNGDVFEVFFHTDRSEAKYFEYEVNQFGKQLLLTISNNSDGMGWIPFNEYDGNTYGTINKVNLKGGHAVINGKIAGWSAEVFISYKSLGLISPQPPKSGTIWNANFCRLDHDAGKMVKWSWTPTIEESLHELDKFRSIIFE